MAIARSAFSAGAGVVVLALSLAGPLHAQDVQYETVTRVEMPGALGTVVRLAARLGGGSTTTVEKTSIKGRMMRTDVDRTSSIVDLDGRRFVEIDHARKTYSTITFDEMAARVREAGSDARAQAGRQGEAQPQRGETQLRFRLAADDPKEREAVAGYSADRFFLTMEAEGEYTSQEQNESVRGTLVVFTDLWLSRDVPVAAAVRSFHEAAAREHAAASAAMIQGLAAALGDDPRLQAGLEESLAKMRSMDGFPLKSTTSFVVVGEGHRFDREMALGDGGAQRGARPGLRGLASRAAAMRASEPAPERAAPPQAALVKVTSEVRNVRVASLDPGLFAIPAGYRQVAFGER